PILKKTSYELFKDRKPIVSHLKPFSCKCFVLNNGKDDLGKFDPRSDEAIFLGYANSSSIFRVFNKRTLLVEENAHVIFNETNTSLKKDIVDDVDFIQGMENAEEPTQEKEDQAKDDPPIENLQEAPQIDEDLPKEWRYAKSHPKENIIGNTSQGITTRSRMNVCNYVAFVSQFEPK